jgi:hypothetical protein
MSTHPLTKPMLVLGIVASGVLALFTSSAVSAYATFTLFAILGLTWRADEPPVLPFVLGFQWLQVTSGYFYFLITGRFPDVYRPGDLDYAVSIALAGLLVLALAIRLVSTLTSPRLPQQTWTVHNLRGLFWLVLGLYAINYLNVLALTTGGGFSVILDRLLQLRQIPLLLLWFEVMRQGRKKEYLWISLAFVFVPQLGSYYSDFKTPLMLLVVVLAAGWRPWEGGRYGITLEGLLRTVTVVGLALFLTMIWQAGVKREIRKAYDVDSVSRDPLARVRLFLDEAENALPVVMNDTSTVVEGLVSRVSYVTFLSRVLEYVPRFEPHADGELLSMAVGNAFMPRFLFPNKPLLPSDSYYTRRFAGAYVMEANTSISIGYMAEFYADWGLIGMFLSVLVYGVIIGVGVWAVRRFAMPYLAGPAMVSAFLVVLPFEHQFIKGFAALLMSVVMAIVLTRVFGQTLARWLVVTADAPAPQWPRR